MIWLGLIAGLLTLLCVGATCIALATWATRYVPQNRTERPVETSPSEGRPDPRPERQSDPPASPEQLQAIAKKLAKSNGGGTVEQWLPIAQKVAPTDAKAREILRI